MYINNNIWVAGNGNNISLQLNMANRHGLIAGASGTGKTVTLKVLAEGFSDAGVPVFMADVKGDLSGVSMQGADSENMKKRVSAFGINDWQYKYFPTVFWDIFGEKGHPLRTTISEMGPMLLARLLGLTDVQEGVLNIVFRIAQDKEMPLIDIKDLRAMLSYVGDSKDDIITTYGNVAPQSVGAILRGLIELENQGGERFFGEPAFDINDWINLDKEGRGYINILESVKLIQSPTLYAFFMLWMLTELYEKMPEVGDCSKPKLVFFFDEAHLLFAEMPRVLLQKVIQVVKLIRSKAIGVYFISQSPSDIPDEVLAQLSNRIQHALRAYTPKEQKAVRTAAETFRPNPDIDTLQAISELSTGEALISLLQPDGSPAMVQRAYILPPQSYMGAIADDVRQSIINEGAMEKKYGKTVDNESAYEMLTDKSDSNDNENNQQATAVIDEDAFKIDAGTGNQQTVEQLQYYSQQSQVNNIGNVDNNQYQQMSIQQNPIPQYPQTNGAGGMGNNQYQQQNIQQNPIPQYQQPNGAGGMGNNQYQQPNIQQNPIPQYPQPNGAGGMGNNQYQQPNIQQNPIPQYQQPNGAGGMGNNQYQQPSIQQNPIPQYQQPNGAGGMGNNQYQQPSIQQNPIPQYQQPNGAGGMGNNQYQQPNIQQNPIPQYQQPSGAGGMGNTKKTPEKKMNTTERWLAEHKKNK